MAEYLEPNNLNVKLTDSKLLFQLKTKMVNVKANYSSSHKANLDCNLCDEEGKKRKDTQKHLLKCPVIRRELSDHIKVNYKDITSDNLSEQLEVVKCVERNLEIRKNWWTNKEDI